VKIDPGRDIYAVERALKALVLALVEGATLGARASQLGDLRRILAREFERSRLGNREKPLDLAAITTYGRLFGLPHGNTDQYWWTHDKGLLDWRGWRQWSVDSPDRVPDRRLQEHHFAAIARVLKAIGIHVGPPPGIGRDRKRQLDFLEAAIKEVAEQIARTTQAPRVESAAVDYGIARGFQERLADLVAHYHVPGKITPFVGRENELKSLSDWLNDETAPSRLLLVAEAGQGKTALLLEWIRQLQETNPLAAQPRHIAFMAASIRAGTANSLDLIQGLAQRLSEISGRAIDAGHKNADDFKHEVRAQLQAVALGGKRVLIVVDGLDEIDRDELVEPLPQELPRHVRVVVSARLELGDSNASGWLHRVGWHRNAAGARTMGLDRLGENAIFQALAKSGPTASRLAKDRAVVRRLAELTGGEPMLVRFYVEDLAGLIAGGSVLRIQDLDGLKPGFDSYFAHWMEAQKWDRHTKQRIDQDDIWRALAVLTFAQGPVSSRDFLWLFSEIHDRAAPVTERYLLEPLRRFVIGNGQKEKGYAFAHPNIAEYLRQTHFLGRADAFDRKFLTLGVAELRDSIWKVAARRARPSIFSCIWRATSSAAAPLLSNGWN